jgi:putative MATE family efflux protein
MVNDDGDARPRAAAPGPAPAPGGPDGDASPAAPAGTAADAVHDHRQPADADGNRRHRQPADAGPGDGDGAAARGGGRHGEPAPGALTGVPPDSNRAAGVPPDSNRPAGLPPDSDRAGLPPDGDRGAGVPADGDRRATDRRILALAVPAFGALVAEPLFLLADSAIVGRLGTVELAGLGVAGAVLSSAVGIFVFLAYGTTSLVARRVGATDTAGALSIGVDALWLSAGIGVVTAAAGAVLAGPIVRVFGAEAAVAGAAETYLRVSMLGLPAMLVVLAATGVLRGLQDTRTPLAVAAAGAVVNAALNVWFVHGLHLGIGGSALGTSLTQLGMAVVTVAVVVTGARRQGARLAPHRAGILTAARTGVPLLVRTLTLRAVLLVTTAVAALQGAPALAAHQVTTSVWTLLALALDALAIAAQALTGAALGAGDVTGTREATRRMVRWGVGAGVVLGIALLLGRGLIAPLFTEDPQVRAAMTAVLVVAAVTQPLAGYVFVLDGVLIGAGDGRYLALAGLAQLVAFVPMAVAIGWFGPHGTAGLVLLWVAFAGGWMASRALLLGLRARSDAWLVTGVP